MYNLRSIAELLMRLPLHSDGSTLAGPPFELPYTLALPLREADCWRLHRDLLQASQRYVRELRQFARGGVARYLDGLANANDSALKQIETVIGG
jgi:hypothetical protein